MSNNGNGNGKPWEGDERREFNWREVTDHMATVNQTLIQLVDKVGKQNGRVGDLEKWKEEINVIIKQREKNKMNNQSLMMVIATVIMAISALVMMFKR